MASTHGSLRQRLALRSASARLAVHSAWRATALVHLAADIGGLELEAHDYSVME